MSKWYLSYGDCRIVVVEVLRETKKTLVLAPVDLRYGRSRRTNKRSSYENYFETWAEAREYEINSKRMRLKSQKRGAGHCRLQLEKALAIPETEPIK